MAGELEKRALELSAGGADTMKRWAEVLENAYRVFIGERLEGLSRVGGGAFGEWEGVSGEEVAGSVLAGALGIGGSRIPRVESRHTVVKALHDLPRVMEKAAKKSAFPVKFSKESMQHFEELGKEAAYWADKFPSEYWDKASKVRWKALEDTPIGPALAEVLTPAKVKIGNPRTWSNPLRKPQMNFNTRQIMEPEFEFETLIKHEMPHLWLADRKKAPFESSRNRLLWEADLPYELQTTEIHAALNEGLDLPKPGHRATKAELDDQYMQTFKVADQIFNESFRDYLQADLNKSLGIKPKFVSSFSIPKPDLTPGNLTKSAIEFGKRATGEDLAQLAEAYAKQQFKYKEFLKAGDFEAAVTESYKAQWYREAFEAAPKNKMLGDLRGITDQAEIDRRLGKLFGREGPKTQPEGSVPIKEWLKRIK